MKKCSVFFALLLAFLMILPAACAEPTVSANDAANALHELGLLAGVGTNKDGSINFDIDGSLTRAQSITQVVRFLGKEKAATSSNFEHPFTDLPAWAVPYVGYAYSTGVTKGISETKFGTDNAMTDAAFLTAILRVLGYNDAAGDFVWSDPYTLAKDVGLISNTTPDANFTRGDAFIICFNALGAKTKDGDTIAAKLANEGFFTMDKYNEVKGNAAKAPESKITPISLLNTNVVDGDHAEDDYRSASLEINYRENVVLNSSVTGYSRYDRAYYPRVKQIREDLYLLLYMYDELGPHIYYATSKDGINWDAPEVLFNEGKHRFTHTYGELNGKNDSYWATNAEACVLDDGTILCVYSVRVSAGYRYYPELCGLHMTKGTVSEDGKISWSESKVIYTGQVWEPSILKRTNGQIEIYFTQVAPDIVKYGYDETHRSTGTGMIVSNDNGETWTPDIKAGDKNYHHAYTVYQEYVGDLMDAYSGVERPHFNGQMPVAVELANGKTLLAVEVRQLDGKFRVSYAVSEADGYWKDLGEEEEGTYVKLTDTPNSSPYVDRFPSGEVYLTHNSGGSLVGRIGAADGSGFGNTFSNAPGASGIWGSCTVIDSHRAVTAMQTSRDGVKGINLYYSYLNHRINAPKNTITVDGYTNDWDGNTDAFFVGSDSQAQVTLRTAHDDENVYFLISRNDYYLTSDDSATICIGVTDTSEYRITADLEGNATLEYYSNGTLKSSAPFTNVKVVIKGTLNNNDDKDEGAIIELGIAKSEVGLTGKTSFPVRLALCNADGLGSITDTFNGASAFLTKYWPRVVLD